MNEKYLVLIMANFFLVIMPALFISSARAVKPAYSKKVRVPVVPGIKWLYDRAVAFMIAPSLDDAGGDPVFAVDLASESLFGASNYATALSNGRLFVEVSPWAELTVFRWPNPTYSDQLRYYTLANNSITAKAKPVRLGTDAPSKDWARYGRPVEPCPGLGSSGGVMTAGGKTMWSHDPVWKSSRHFEPEGGTILLTELEGDEVHLLVEDYVHPELDLMAREFTIRGPAEKFLYHATFAPFKAKPGEYTSSNPKKAGFAALYIEEKDLVVHFKPNESTAGRARKVISPNGTYANLDDLFPEGGVFIAWGFDQKSDEHQVGAVQCRDYPRDAPPGGEVEARDGSLSMNDYYEGEGDAALAKRLEGGEHRVTVYISIADSSEEAIGIIKRARKDGSKLKMETLDHWRGVSGKVLIPSDAGEINSRVAKRSILNLIQGQNKEGGCIVASVSRQPAYNFDWPRDGAFFDLALDMAGFTELVDKHHEFYSRTQFDKKIGFAPVRMANFQTPFYRPAGHWPSNMAADGSNGSVPRFMPFEIDETALMAWDMWRHERILSDEQKEKYTALMKPTLKMCADALVEYVDFKQGWTRPAIEDDGFPPGATLHGVASVLTGLASACDAGPRWGMEQDKYNKWSEAAAVLREGAKARIGQPDVLERAGWRGQAWSLWPAPIFEDYSEPAASQIKRALAKKIKEKKEKNTPGFAYLGEEIFTLALADQESGEYRELLAGALEFLTTEVPFPGTDCYGEVTLWVEFDGKRVSQQRTSIPHIWNGVTIYLAVMAIYEPEAFDRMKPPVPCLG
jgi:hypothetical protein